MSSAGRQGMSDTGMGNPLGAQPGPGASGMPLGTDAAGTGDELQPDTVEVVEVVTLEGTASPYEEDLYGQGQVAGGYRWWYVPAVAVPVIAGGALFWYMRNGKQPFKDFSDLLGRRGNDVSDWLQDRIPGVRRQTPDLKARTAAMTAAIAIAPLWDRAGDWLEDRLDEMSDLIDRDRARETAMTARDSARAKLGKAAKTTKITTAAVATSNRWDDFREMLADAGDTLGDTVLGWWEGVRGGTTAPRVTGKARDLRDQVRGGTKSTASKAALAAGAGKVAIKAAKPVSSAVSTVSGAKDSTARAMKKTGKSVNSAFKRTRAFTFAMLVTAMYTYMRMWRQRMNERTMRETASGRLVPDTEPSFSR